MSYELQKKIEGSSYVQPQTCNFDLNETFVMNDNKDSYEIFEEY